MTSSFQVRIHIFFLFFSLKQTTQKNKDKYRVSNKNTYGPNIE